jgi:hypothetical protein
VSGVVAASGNKQFLLAPATRSRPFGTSALRSRRLPAQASRPPADVRNLERSTPWRRITRLNLRMTTPRPSTDGGLCGRPGPVSFQGAGLGLPNPGCE